MSTLRRILGFAACAVVWLAVAIIPSAEAALVTVYSENFDSFNTGALGGQNGWAATGGTPQVVVGDAGGTDKVVAGTNASTQGNGQNLGLFSLSSSTTQLILEGRMRMRDGFGNRVNFVDSGGTEIFGFGAGFGGFSFVVVDPSDAKLFSGNASGGNALTASHAWYDVIFTIDFNGNADATGSYQVKRTGQASFSTLASNLDLQLAPTYEDPTLWTGLLLEMRTSSDQQDDFLITAVVPEPRSMALGLAAFGALGIAVLVRSRRK